MAILRAAKMPKDLQNEYVLKNRKAYFLNLCYLVWFDLHQPAP